ncbi:hypothetical protein [Kibdelosporangium phytohabitans]|uniref:Uncharacterized protein n=1 Tax=Kibdelosporangium phytohabitans TaxID=860235 RepID=A0A0N9HZI8_9PSEU|nr:hypothetical protein [Kibdelosporangium phytohabitans]ALG09149.1 hypothetical protein AOZ06_21535 [Kibdelosporangium phytohabitans]MBE1469631.1 hypothetical protein [Kibdelosporangium phytohabitans]
MNSADVSAAGCSTRFLTRSRVASSWTVADPADRLAMSLAAAPDIVVLPDGDRARAEMVVVLCGETTDELMAEMRRTAAEAVEPTRRLVLVADKLHSRHLPQASRCGVVSMLPVREASPAMVAHVVFTSYHGGAVLPRRGDQVARGRGPHLRAGRAGAQRVAGRRADPA